MLRTKINISNIITSGGTLSVPFNLSFSPETQQYDFIEKNFEEVKNGYINETIDYEKVKLSPYYLFEDNLSKLYSIKLNPHFFIGSDWTTGNTNILDIGFTSDDIIYRRKRIDNSFLRLLFYDSIDPKTQNLLYFSVVFLNGGDLYSKYLQSGSTSGLTCEFIIEDPKYSNELRTSEGFFTYLFKEDLINSNIKSIYLKVEFNNAADGNTTLFTKEKPTGLGFTVKELYDNMYFKIYCKFDETINNYVYWFDGLSPENSDLTNKKIKNVLNLEIYQARLL